ncbi:heme o synthase [Thalassoglobus sp.]|uniref:heme o synthase n=1 Tax=Thalassoglobus sp. TaxID=2795869 RepID=UPI003AA93311
MSTSVMNPVRSNSAVKELEQRSSIATRLACYAEMAKPRIALMVLLSMGVGYLLGSEGVWRLTPLLNASIGVVLAVFSASALNQVYERHTDAKMARTENRPLPSGKLTTSEVLLFAIACSIVSFIYLLLTVNPLTAVLTATTTVLYAGVYTPLKRHTTFCTAVGAIPGAAPPVLGWVAAGGSLDIVAFSLFAILFVWQFPHFLAIAWMYHDQYAGAGLKMVPGAGRPKVIGAISLGYALVLLPVSLLPTHFGLAGDFYAVVAILLGIVYAVAAFGFYRDESRQQARRLLFASLIYLPGVLLAMTFDHLRLLNEIL